MKDRPKDVRAATRYILTHPDRRNLLRALESSEDCRRRFGAGLVESGNLTAGGAQRAINDALTLVRQAIKQTKPRTSTL